MGLVLFLQTRELQFREVKRLARGHTARKEGGCLRLGILGKEVWGGAKGEGKACLSPGVFSDTRNLLD